MCINFKPCIPPVVHKFVLWSAICVENQNFMKLNLNAGIKFIKIYWYCRALFEGYKFWKEEVETIFMKWY